MLSFIQFGQIDIAIFAVLSLVAMGAVHIWLHRTRKGAGIPPFAWLLLLFFIAYGGWQSEKAAVRERDSLRQMLEGFAPTYAHELQRMGHERISLETPADDPLYLTLVNAEIQWLKINPMVNDIYTFRMKPDGTVVLLVDSETDYDRNGRHEGEREVRTAIGEVYPQADTNLKRTFKGIASFDGIPYTDRWGTWVSAYVPMMDSSGRVEAVLGVDYSAKEWVRAISARRVDALTDVGIIIFIYISSIALILLARYEKKEKDINQWLLLKTASENLRLAQAVESASDGIIITDPHQRDNPIIYANDAFSKITGYSVKEALGKNCRFLQGPETDPRAVKEVREAIRDKKPVKVTLLNYRKDGSKFWNGLRISPVFSKDGTLQYYLGFQADVTKRMEAEMALIAERDYNASILRGTPAVVCGISPQGVTNFINPAGEKVTGYSSEELVGKNWWDVFYPEKEYAQVEKLLQDFEKGDVRDYEMTLTTKSGERRTISWNSMNRTDPDGTVIEIVGFGNDVTARARAEEDLRKSEEAFRFMLLSAPVMVWMAGVDQKFVYVNRFWAEFTGRKVEEELGGGWMEGVHADDRMLLLNSYDAAFRNRVTFKMEFRLRHVSGEHRWVIATGTPSFKDDGSFAGFIGSCLDVHERKKLEAQLLQAQKMETVGTLAGGIAHDLNNQLTPLSGYIDLVMKETPAGDPRRDLLVEAELAARRCAEVVQRLMNFSRTSTQKKTWLKTQTVMEELKRVLPKFIPKTIESRVVFSADLWPVMGNETELQTVLMNMATNARDAMPEGGKLEVTAENKELDIQSVRGGHGPGTYVLISFKDAGQGIPPHLISKIFEPFFTTKQKGQGTGLGLAMVFRIVRDHGGWLDVSSVVGKGTIFQIYLPADPAQKGAPAAPDKAETLPRGNETILFADDEEALRSLGRVFLERLGYKVLLASDGEEAVRLYQERRAEIDAIVLDMTMPKMTGRQAMKKMLELNPSARILLASGYTSEGSAKELIQDGAADFLSKPYTIMPLAQALRKVIGQP